MRRIAATLPATIIVWQITDKKGVEMEQINTKLEWGLKVTSMLQPFRKKTPPPKYFAIIIFSGLK